LKRLLALLCGLLAAVALLAILAPTLVDVLGRKRLRQAVTGSLALTELLMVVLIFATLPLVRLRGGPVVFDSLDPLLPVWLRRAQRSALAWLMWDKAAQRAGYGDTTAQLKLPLGPFVRLMAVLCGVTAPVHSLLLWPGGAANEAETDAAAGAANGGEDQPMGGAT
jgi:TRAP-type C4-dicarboxylate transport system permease small subunit